MIVVTPALLQNGLEKNTINLENISLIVFDECHHCVGDHSYNKVLENINESPSPYRPHLLGLSASLVMAKTFENTVSNLEKIREKFRGVVLTATQSTSDVIQKAISCKFTSAQTEFSDAVKSMAEHILRSQSYDYGIDLNNPKLPLSEISFGYQMARDHSSLLKDEKNTGHPVSLIFKIHLCAVENFYFGSTAAKILFNSFFPHLSADVNTTIDKGGKFNSLFEVLQEFANNKEGGVNNKLMIFEKERWLANRLKDELRKLDWIKNGGVEISTLLGLNDSSSEGYSKYRDIVLYKPNDKDKKSPFKPSRIDSDNTLSRTDQEKVIRDFEESTNKHILISTSVGEEGLDINVSSVIYLGSMPNCQTLIQSRGRIRTKEGKYIVIDYNADRFERAMHQEYNLKQALSSPDLNQSLNSISNNFSPVRISSVASSGSSPLLEKDSGKIMISRKLDSLLRTKKVNLTEENAKSICNELCQLSNTKMTGTCSQLNGYFTATVEIDNFSSFCEKKSGEAATNKKKAEASAWYLYLLQLLPSSSPPSQSLSSSSSSSSDQSPNSANQNVPIVPNNQSNSNTQIPDQTPPSSPSPFNPQVPLSPNNIPQVPFTPNLPPTSPIHLNNGQFDLSKLPQNFPFPPFDPSKLPQNFSMPFPTSPVAGNFAPNSPISPNNGQMPFPFPPFDPSKLPQMPFPFPPFDPSKLPQNFGQPVSPNVNSLHPPFSNFPPNPQFQIPHPYANQPNINIFNINPPK